MEGLKDQLSLEKMLALFEVDVEGLTQHRSDDDAHITMLVTEALCRKTGKPLSVLVKESKRAVCLSKTYMPKKKKQKAPAGAVSSAKDGRVQGESKPKSNGNKPKSGNTQSKGQLKGGQKSGSKRNSGQKRKYQNNRKQKATKQESEQQ